MAASNADYATAAADFLSHLVDKFHRAARPAREKPG